MKNMEKINVKSIRESMKLTQEQFADLLGVSVRTIGNWESGAAIPATKIKSLQALLTQPSHRQYAGGCDSQLENIEHEEHIGQPKSDEELVKVVLNSQRHLSKSQEQIDRLIAVIEKMTPNIK